MTENPGNINIFEGATGSFQDALPLFTGVSGTVLPVRTETSGPAQLCTITQISEAGRPALPSFTNEDLLDPPLIRKTLAETALLFFHAPLHEVFVFNPRHPKARLSAAQLKASRREISLLAGFLKSGDKKTQQDPSRLAAGEFSLGNLHSAHYLYHMAAFRNPASRARFQLGAVLIELGLLQEAYDLLKADTDPEALICLAAIHRKTGNIELARKALSELGQGNQLEERRNTESAWLDIEEGKEAEAEKNFQRLSSSAFEKAEALSGLGAAMARAAFKTKDRNRLAAAVSALRSALATPSSGSGRIFFQLGNLYFRSGDLPQAEACYRRSAAQAPAVQALANLALTLIKTGKLEEAAAITLQVALTDLTSAKRLTAEFPKDRLAALFRVQEAGPAPQPLAAAKPEPAPGPERQPAPEFTPAPQPAPQKTPGLQTAAEGFRFINPAAPAPAKAAKPVQLSPAQPLTPTITGRQPATAPAEPAPAPQIEIETFRDVMHSSSQPTEEESRKDEFISRAFKLASELEDELGHKIYFNLDGLNEAERRLRLKFIKSGAGTAGKLDAVRDSAAFLCYFLQERHKGRLIKLADFDPWGWPMLFDQPGLKLVTYPVQRAWKMLWQETVPEPGWLTKYTNWLADRLKQQPSPVCGAEAARAKVCSHPEKIADAQTEHKRMMVLISSLNETSGIELGRSGLLKMENAIKINFRPDIPPTADGWKLLRCYGHLLAAILAKDFKATWYNVDGEDGGWSMQLPWKTFVFPLGKIYKTASLRDDLNAYYEVLLEDKLRYQSRTQGLIGP